MADYLRYTSIITDEKAEGAPENSDIDDIKPAQHAATTRAVKAPPNDLSGETGMMSAVFVPAERTDNTDGQDASRTTAEISRATAPQPQTFLPRRVAPLVLIVEDTVELAEVIQASLQRLDMVAIIEGHGDSALRRLEQIEPDVVLLDIALPDTSGWRLLENIKEMQRAGKPMPIIIVITAYGDAANRLVGKLQNVHSYLVKPFTADEVTRIVTQALNSKV